MADPIIIGAVSVVSSIMAKFGGKVIDRMFDSNHRQNATAIDNFGNMHSVGFSSNGGYTILDPEFFGWIAIEPTNCVVQFVPADQRAVDWLTGEQPVLVVVNNEESGSDLDGLVIPMRLEEPFSLGLYPGRYAISAFVFVDDDIDEIDGFGYTEFNVNLEEPDFSLQIEVVSDDDGSISALFADL